MIELSPYNIIPDHVAESLNNFIDLADRSSCRLVMASCKYSIEQIALFQSLSTRRTKGKILLEDMYHILFNFNLVRVNVNKMITKIVNGSHNQLDCIFIKSYNSSIDQLEYGPKNIKNTNNNQHLTKQCAIALNSARQIVFNKIKVPLIICISNNETETFLNYAQDLISYRSKYITLSSSERNLKNLIKSINSKIANRLHRYVEKRDYNEEIMLLYALIDDCFKMKSITCTTVDLLLSLAFYFRACLMNERALIIINFVEEAIRSQSISNDSNNEQKIQEIHRRMYILKQVIQNDGK